MTNVREISETDAEMWRRLLKEGGRDGALTFKRALTTAEDKCVTSNLLRAYVKEPEVR